jgi:4-amino-4-deoxy-L-arabinose transferase-like glycosyltransferase
MDEPTDPTHAHRAAASASPRGYAAVLLLLVAAYVLPGLFGHDPWKPDEPYTFGAVLHMIKTGDWVVPTVGAQPFMEKPPLYYWVAWATAKAASPPLPLHDAARIASLVFVLASLAAVAAAAQLLWGEGAAALAALLFLGTLGLEGNAQRMQVDLALLAGFSIAVLGFAGCARGKGWGGLALGAGIGIGFLGKGLFALAVIGLTAFLLPVFFREWRARRYFVQLLYAAAAAMPFVLIWPLALLSRSERLFREWIWDNNLGRFSGYATTFLGAGHDRGDFGQAFVWFLFPTWLYVVGAVHREGRRSWYQPGMQVGLTMFTVGALVLASSASLREVYFLPLVPAAVLAAVVALRGPEGRYQRALGAFACVAGGFLALIAWSAWGLLLFTGAIPEWQPLARRLPAQFDMPFSTLAFVIAALLTAGFLALVRFRHRLIAPSLTLWVAAVALGWGLAHTLWLPWLDSARSYRALFAEIAQRLPEDTHCIVMDGPGESERAMVEYFIGVTPRQRFLREDECRAILWKGNRIKGHPRYGEGLDPVWTGARPGDPDERFDLVVKPR